MTKPVSTSFAAPLATPLRVVLISPYELGRQPFSLAHASAVLQPTGAHVDCLDLSLDPLDEDLIRSAHVIAINIPMFTAMRLATAILTRIPPLAPTAQILAFGWYAHVNADHLQDLGVDTVVGGEFESELLTLVEAVGAHLDNVTTPLEATANAPTARGFIEQPAKVAYQVPLRTHLPPLARYAHLQLPDGSTRMVGFVESTRGCKYQCRHCPVVPVYHGRFRAIPADIVLADIEQQVAAGAQHISFGDPDFFNGVTHALRILERMHARYPQLTFDATIKIEHLVKHAAHLPTLKRYGCLFITSAAEAVDDNVLAYLDKGHTRADLVRAVALLREAGITMAPTFVAFTPWTTLASYVELLRDIVDLDLIDHVAPVQLAIRLLIPRGSYLFNLPGFDERVDAFDPELLGYPWASDDPRVDELQLEIQAWAQQAESDGLDAQSAFEGIWQRAHAALGLAPPALPPRQAGPLPPRLTEQWYCCAEPTPTQMNRARSDAS